MTLSISEIRFCPRCMADVSHVGNGNFRCSVCAVGFTVIELMDPPAAKPVKPLPGQKGIDLTAGLNDDVAEALEQCDRIMEGCAEVPERGADYANDVQDKVADVRETIERTQKVTPRQASALDGWEAGIDRWINR